MPDSPRARPDRSRTRSAAVWGVLRGVLDEADGRALDVVDVGGGTGGFAVPLATLGHTVTVVDPSPDALAALERRVAETAALDGLAGRVRARQGDVAGLLDVVEPASADLVLCHGVLEHVDDPVEALAAVARCLRPGGRLSLLAANRSAVVLARAVAGRFAEAQQALLDPAGRWGDRDPVPRRFSPQELEELVRSAGLEPVHVVGVRVFADLVPGALVDGEPGAVEALLQLEAAAAEHPAFLAVATQIHLLARA
ncbi:methyltransferase family protein [Motilibacter rhizosphaerae]|uniref:Methyltransferase family protein n=1 Tax=Motilibacter rhizosphaerae TaxID=598652 RepID=A0A4V2F3F5_9ACTN|nr:methyltransferase domain-containing protein [Motilibacter rhizosphaerae]RZS82933.1 methyltransferase family protein [Motilibacter rhizosphaerae]